jgi:hypothetical protein
VVQGINPASKDTHLAKKRSMSESESSLRTIGFDSAEGLGLFLAIREIKTSVLFTLSELAVGFSLGFFLTGFLIVLCTS